MILTRLHEIVEGGQRLDVILGRDLLILLGLQFELKPGFGLLQLRAFQFQRFDPVLERPHGGLAALGNRVGQVVQLGLHSLKLAPDTLVILPELLDRAGRGLVRFFRESADQVGFDMEALHELQHRPV